MRKRRVEIPGFLAMVVALVLFIAPNAFALNTSGVSANDADRVDFIDTLNKKETQSDSMTAEDAVTRVMIADKDKLTRVDIIDSDAELEGPAYNYHTPLSH